MLLIMLPFFQRYSLDTEPGAAKPEKIETKQKITRMGLHVYRLSVWVYVCMNVCAAV